MFCVIYDDDGEVVESYEIEDYEAEVEVDEDDILETAESLIEYAEELLDSI